MEALHTSSDDPEVAKADARLIVAATELLEACQAMKQRGRTVVELGGGAK